MHPIATMCRALAVSPAGYYAHIKRPPSARARTDAEVSARIAAIHQRSRRHLRRAAHPRRTRG
jgi:hypothetical protein